MEFVRNDPELEWVDCRRQVGYGLIDQSVAGLRDQTRLTVDLIVLPPRKPDAVQRLKRAIEGGH